MIKRTQKELIKNLEEQEGYSFHQFTLSQEGQFEISDADWNYKDVPHLKYIHQLVEGYPSYMADDFIGAILVQKIFWFKVPTVIFNYQSGVNRQTYHITLFWFILIIETSYESVKPGFTRVNTNYAIGAKSIFKLFYPLIKFAIKRNYKDLMSGDIPMRLRRGQIRSWGYKFKGDDKPYSFYKTTLIAETNVVPPELPPVTFKVSIEDLMRSTDGGGAYRVGRSDHQGLSFYRDGNTVSAFPRLCPHEGASLDNENCKGGAVFCPWHNRRFSPVAKIDIGLKVINMAKDGFVFKFEDGILSVDVRGRNISEASMQT